MRIGGIYSFNQGQTALTASYMEELAEVEAIISAIDAGLYLTRPSREKTIPGRILYSPRLLNKAFAQAFNNKGWKKHREYCDYPTGYYTADYTPQKSAAYPFREMDFVKNNVGVEVQFGKYAFMVYNVAAKMTIFRNLGVIQVGIEIVPLKELADQMSTGVSYFEQFVWDLEHRGVADIDVPVLILGVRP